MFIRWYKNITEFSILNNQSKISCFIYIEQFDTYKILITIRENINQQINNKFIIYNLYILYSTCHEATTQSHNDVNAHTYCVQHGHCLNPGQCPLVKTCPCNMKKTIYH